MGTHFSIMNKDVRVLDFSIVRDLYTLNFIMNTIYKSNQITNVSFPIFQW